MDSAPRRRWLRFSLRTMFVAITVVAVCATRWPFRLLRFLRRRHARGMPDLWTIWRHADKAGDVVELRNRCRLERTLAAESLCQSPAEVRMQAAAKAVESSLE